MKTAKLIRLVWEGGDAPANREAASNRQHTNHYEGPLVDGVQSLGARRSHQQRATSNNRNRN